MTTSPFKVTGLRSQAARDRIIVAARRVFAASGYERATVRVIAAEAKVAPAMLIRYYGSKSGVFAAAVEFNLEIPDLSKVPPDKLGAHLVTHFLDRWEAPDRRGDLAALLRASVDHREARDRLAAIFTGQLVSALRGVTHPDATQTCAVLVATQMLGLAFCRYVLELAPAKSLPREVIVMTIGATVQRYLNNRLVDKVGR